MPVQHAPNAQSDDVVLFSEVVRTLSPTMHTQWGVDPRPVQVDPRPMGPDPPSGMGRGPRAARSVAVRVIVTSLGPTGSSSNLADYTFRREPTGWERVEQTGPVIVD